MQKSLTFLFAALAVGLLTQGCKSPQEESKRYADALDKSGKIGYWNSGLFNCKHGERTPNADSPTGYLLELKDLKFARESKVVPAELGSTFGIIYYLPNTYTNANARAVYSFPPIKNPDTGKVFTCFERERPLGPQPGLYQMVYTFAEDYELVEGKWTFQLFLKDKLVVERRFTVVRKHTS